MWISEKHDIPYGRGTKIYKDLGLPASQQDTIRSNNVDEAENNICNPSQQLPQQEMIRYDREYSNIEESIQFNHEMYIQQRYPCICI